MLSPKVCPESSPATFPCMPWASVSCAATCALLNTCSPIFHWIRNLIKGVWKWMPLTCMICVSPNPQSHSHGWKRLSFFSDCLQKCFIEFELQNVYHHGTLDSRSEIVVGFGETYSLVMIRPISSFSQKDVPDLPSMSSRTSNVSPGTSPIKIQSILFIKHIKQNVYPNCCTVGTKPETIIMTK